MTFVCITRRLVGVGEYRGSIVVVAVFDVNNDDDVVVATALFCCCDMLKDV